MDNKTLLNDMDICIAGECYFRRCSFFSIGEDCEECMTELIIEARSKLKNIIEENEAISKQYALQLVKLIELDKQIQNIKKDVAREIFEGIEKETNTYNVPFSNGEIRELIVLAIDKEKYILFKKKYTESEDTE